MIDYVFDVILFALVSLEHFQDEVLRCRADVNVVGECDLVSKLVLNYNLRYAEGRPST